MEHKLPWQCLLLCFVLIQLFPLNNLAQTSKETRTPFYFSLNYRNGENKPHRNIIKNLTYPYEGVDLKFGWQSIGKQSWQQAYRYPSFGVGANWCTFSTDVLGSPAAIYFYTNFPQLSTRYLRVDLELDMGLSYGIHPYDKVNNPNNFSTGSSMNALFGLYIEQSLHVGKHLDLFVSEGFSHYSNGALGYPNLGLNIPSYKLGLRYQPNVVELIRSDVWRTKHYGFELITHLASGAKTLNAPDPLYMQYLLAPALYYRPSYKRRIGMGLELAYNEAVAGWSVKNTYSGLQLLTLGIFAAHEFIIEKFTLFGQFGIYLWNKPTGKFYYERIGASYYLTRPVRLALSLKAHYFKAEYVEGGLIFDLPFSLE